MKYKVEFLIEVGDKQYQEDLLSVKMKLDFIPTIGQKFNSEFFHKKIIKDFFNEKNSGGINYKFVQSLLLHSNSFLEKREGLLHCLNVNEKTNILTPSEVEDVKKELDFWSKGRELFGFPFADALGVKQVRITEKYIEVDLVETEYI